MDNYMNSDAALRQYFHQLEDYALLFLDHTGQIVRTNQGAGIMKGYSCEEMAGMHFSEFYTPEARAIGHPQRELGIAAAVGRYEEDGWRVRKDGSRFWAHIVITAIFDEEQTLRGFAKILREFTHQKQAGEQSANAMKLLDLAAHTDYLTGVDNRRSLDRELITAFSNAQQHQSPISLARIDLDHFQEYSDTFGHASGDAFLKDATGAWRRALRPSDFLALYRGGEFAIVLRNTARDEAIVCMERVRLATPGALTCSIGIAQWDQTESPTPFIARAERALSEAKSSGRNCTAFDANTTIDPICQPETPMLLAAVAALARRRRLPAAHRYATPSWRSA